MYAIVPYALQSPGSQCQTAICILTPNCKSTLWELGLLTEPPWVNRNLRKCGWVTRNWTVIKGGNFQGQIMNHSYLVFEQACPRHEFRLRGRITTNRRRPNRQSAETVNEKWNWNSYFKAHKVAYKIPAMFCKMLDSLPRNSHRKECDVWNLRYKWKTVPRTPSCMAYFVKWNNIS